MNTGLTNSRGSAAPRILALLLVVVSLCFESKVPQIEAKSRETEVRIGVFGLFHPQQLRVTAVRGSTLMLRAGDQQILLESSGGTGSATISKIRSGILLSSTGQSTSSSQVFVSGRNGEVAEFQLAVPGKIARRFRGTLAVRISNDELISVVTMDVETAVASVVAAENLPDTPMEALKAQAVAARSYFVSGQGRHADFDFCDTTHCQFLREAPVPGSAVTRAVSATQGLVLAYESKPFPAMYTRSCSGQTRTPVQIGLHPSAYPYFSVACEYCRSHPARWTRRLASRDTTLLHSSDESSRLAIGRRLGWSAVASNDFIAHQEGDETVLQGTGHGHGVGLCQAGARAMAQRGASFQQILRHYYPNTSTVTWRGELSAMR